MTSFKPPAPPPPYDPLAARVALGWTQSQIAKALGISLRQWVYYENGQRDGKPVARPPILFYALAWLVCEYSAPSKLEKPSRESARQEKAKAILCHSLESIDDLI